MKYKYITASKTPFFSDPSLWGNRENICQNLILSGTRITA